MAQTQIMLTRAIIRTDMQQIIAHGVDHVVEELGDVLFGLAFHAIQHFLE